MISFDTSRFGLINVEENRIIFFPEGIPGFPDLRRYILMDYEDTALKWLQAVDDPDVAFIVVEPHLLKPDYKITLDNSTRQRLNLIDDNDLAVLVILRREGQEIIANFNGPLLLNAGTMQGVQIFLDTAT